MFVNGRPDGTPIPELFLEIGTFVDLDHDHGVEDNDGDVGDQLNENKLAPENVVGDVIWVLTDFCLDDVAVLIQSGRKEEKKVKFLQVVLFSTCV